MELDPAVADLIFTALVAPVLAGLGFAVLVFHDRFRKRSGKSVWTLACEPFIRWFMPQARIFGELLLFWLVFIAAHALPSFEGFKQVHDGWDCAATTREAAWQALTGETSDDWFSKACAILWTLGNAAMWTLPVWAVFCRAPKQGRLAFVIMFLLAVSTWMAPVLFGYKDLRIGYFVWSGSFVAVAIVLFHFAFGKGTVGRAHAASPALEGVSG